MKKEYLLIIISTIIVVLMGVIGYEKLYDKIDNLDKKIFIKSINTRK